MNLYSKGLFHTSVISLRLCGCFLLKESNMLNFPLNYTVLSMLSSGKAVSLL